MSITDSVVIVAGASRGAGRGIAESLSDAGAIVYATGRSVDAAELPARVVRVRCDHANDEDVERLFRQVDDEHRRLDILVNSVWGGYERMVENNQFTWPARFWDQPRWRWDAMMTTGVRAAFVASQLAAQRMVRAKRGLIVNLSHWAAKKHIGNTIYGISKAATDKLTADTAHELRPHGVAVVSLYPGLVRTEAVLAAGVFDLSNSESPQFLGRTIAALATDPNLLARTGEVLVVAALAREYGVTDVDGKSPTPLTIADV